MPASRTRAVRAASIMATAFFAALLAHGCSDEITPPGGDTPAHISGNLVYTSECKADIYGIAGAMVNLDCVTWDWDGSDTLSVVHVNAALNCCPGTIAGDIRPVYRTAGDYTRLVGLEITETEGEDAAMCRCLCLYDLSYEISGMQGGPLWIRFIEKYIEDGAEPLEVTVDLDAEPQGSLCLFRGTYPWGTDRPGDDPVGTIDGYSGCNDMTDTPGFPGPFSADSSCVVVYTMPADSSMRIFHLNTAYNCCVDALDADFEFSGSLITISGHEYPAGGLCDCTCLYDVTYSIGNLDPGVYTVRFLEPYLPPDQEQLEITVDMSQTGCWTGCAAREGYPWGEGSGEEADRRILGILFDKIVEYIGTPHCGEGACRYIGYGSKPCGGPWGYLVYSADTVDEEFLRLLVDAHAAYENYMNHKYGYSSDCSIPDPPGVGCRDGVCGEVRR